MDELVKPIELPKNDHIIKQKTRILRPSEYAAFREQLNPVHQILSDVALNTGMRWGEIWALVKHPEWYRASRRCIDMPMGSIKKVRCLQLERTILLTQNGCNAVELLLGLKLKRPVARSNLLISYRLAASKSIGIEGISPKMLRKTLVSWLIKSMPEKALVIASSMGHNMEIMRRHYLGIAFERQAIEDMREYLKGWGDT
jgi:integrase